MLKRPKCHTRLESMLLNDMLNELTYIACFGVKHEGNDCVLLWVSFMMKDAKCISIQLGKNRTDDVICDYVIEMCVHMSAGLCTRGLGYTVHTPLHTSMSTNCLHGSKAKFPLATRAWTSLKRRVFSWLPMTAR